jgi:uncharacterized damage-inducible protein DinB
MEKDRIPELLEEKYQTLISWLEQQPADHWESGPEGKWTTGQVVKHLLQSITPLNAAMSLPKFILKYKYGVSNREVRDYDSVVRRYRERLEEARGITYRRSRQMKVPSIKEKRYLLGRLQVESKKLQYKTAKRWNDRQLNTLILPHPLMGKMPVREMVMWTAYHVEHHTKQLMENY